MSSQPTYNRIVETANRLIYQQGYEQTSFTDIATEVSISRGNFYHHFKSKNDILQAVIQKRLDDRRALVSQWEAQGTNPAERIGHFINLLLVNQAQIERYGCPIGTLTSELAKTNHQSTVAAAQLFTLFRTWLAKQFTQMGYALDADEKALHLLARSQGIAVMMNAFNDDAFVQREVEQLQAWVDHCQEHSAPANDRT